GGAFCSPPSPSPSDIGSMPRTIAVAVMITGRSRVRSALSAAVTGSAPSRRRSRAKVTTMMLFAVATPMLISVPIKAGTLSVVPVTKRPHTSPASVPGDVVVGDVGGTEQVRDVRHAGEQAGPEGAGEGGRSEGTGGGQLRRAAGQGRRFERLDRVDPYLRRLDGHRILHAGLRIHPEVRRGLRARRQRDE